MSEPIPYPTSQAAYPVTKPAAAPQVAQPVTEEPLRIAEMPVESKPEIVEAADLQVEEPPVNAPIFFDLKPVSQPLVEAPVAGDSDEWADELVEEQAEELVVEPSQESDEEQPEKLLVELSQELDEHVDVESVPVDDPELFVEPQLETIEAYEEVEPISPFQISPTLVMEPQTNSIVIAEIPDPIRSADIVTDSGLILKTDSIEIVPVTTGQIEIIPESPESDVADSIDSAASFVPSVAPVRASGVMNSKALVGALPSRRRRVMDLTVTSVTLGIAILTVSVLAFIGYMLGVLK